LDPDAPCVAAVKARPDYGLVIPDPQGYAMLDTLLRCTYVQREYTECSLSV